MFGTLFRTEREKCIMDKERNLGIDIIKIVAMIFVVVLHVNGYISDTFLDIEIPYSTAFIWHVLEAIAYPAIHLFVMASAWYLVDSKSKHFNGAILKIWLPTFIVCIVGLLIALIVGIPVGIKELLRSIFPFAGRAYWYVSDYILLLLFAPFLNSCINSISHKQLSQGIIVLILINCIAPTFLTIFDWNQNYSNIGLFILLYFVVAYIKSSAVHLKVNRKIWGGVWVLSIMILFCSWIVIGKIGNVFPIFQGREEYFYQYSSPFVIAEAIGAFLFLLNNKTHSNRVVTTIANASLIVYLIHMHPAFKAQYVNYGLLQKLIIDNSACFLLESLGIVMVIVLCGVIISIPINRIAEFIKKKIVMMLDKI